MVAHYTLKLATNQSVLGFCQYGIDILLIFTKKTAIKFSIVITSCGHSLGFHSICRLYY